MKVRLGLFVIAVIASGLLVTDCNGSGLAPENSRILAAIPVYPGAHQIDTKNEVIYEYECEHPCNTIGHRTKASYEIPPDVSSRTLVDFFSEHLPDWHPRIEEIRILETGTRAQLLTATPEIRHTGQFSASLSRGDDRIYVNGGIESSYGGKNTYSVTVETRTSQTVVP